MDLVTHICCLGVVSQFFSILSDLKCYRSAFSSFLQIIFEMQSQRSSQKRAVKKIHGLHFDPSCFIGA
jgi:hypothetical protein